MPGGLTFRIRFKLIEVVFLDIFDIMHHLLWISRKILNQSFSEKFSLFGYRMYFFLFTVFLKGALTLSFFIFVY